MIICTLRIREWEHQIWNWSASFQPEIAPLFTISFQCFNKKKDFQKLAGLWLADEVVNHVGIYGSKAAEGLSGVPTSVLLYVCLIYFTKVKGNNISSVTRYIRIQWPIIVSIRWVITCSGNGLSPVRRSHLSGLLLDYCEQPWRTAFRKIWIKFKYFISTDCFGKCHRQM